MLIMFHIEITYIDGHYFHSLEHFKFIFGSKTRTRFFTSPDNIHSQVRFFKIKARHNTDRSPSKSLKVMTDMILRRSYVIVIQDYSKKSTADTDEEVEPVLLRYNRGISGATYLIQMKHTRYQFLRAPISKG